MAKFQSDADLAVWLSTPEAKAIMRKTPQMVNTAKLSQAHRFYWFDIAKEVDLGGNWKLGANLHFSGDIGGVWVTLEYKVFEGTPNEQLVKQSYEVHPKKPTMNPERIWMQNRLRRIALIAENWDQPHPPAGAENYEKGLLTFDA